MTASIFKADATDGSSYFIKLKHGHHLDASQAVVQLLHDAGVERLIVPIQTLQGQPNQRLGDSTLIVYPFVEGENGFSRPLSGPQWLELGKTMRKIHDIEVPPSIQQKIRRENYSTKWREIVRSLNNHVQVEPVGDKIAISLVNFMRANRSTISRLVERAEELSQELAEQPPQFVLCHSDIHAGNVLLGNNDAMYIVDWDDPIMAPKERDLMFIGGGVANVWNRPDEEQLFYQGYQTTQIDTKMLAYYRHERIVEDIAEYGEQLLWSSAGGAQRLVMYEQFIAMFEPRGVVDIALKGACAYSAATPYHKNSS